MIKEIDIKKKIKVALYARVSTEEQKDNFSLGSQLDLLRKHATDNNYEIHDEYVDDGYSGTSHDRPHFQRLLDDSRLGRFEIILVYRIDRFFRNNKDLLNVVDCLEKIGIAVKSITEPFDTSYLGKFVLSLFGSIAELERNTFMERSRLGKLKRARLGFYSGSSPSKFGYTYNKETKKLEINEHEAKVVRMIYTLYIQPDSSITKVTRMLRKVGYKTKTGRPWETDRVDDILKDETYTGIWHANKHFSIKGKSQGLKPREEWIEVKVPDIVTKEVFEGAQQLLDARKNYSRRNVRYKYLLQNLIRCGDCGSTLAGTADKSIQKANGRKYGPYYRLYYRCTHFVKNKFEKLVKCRLKYVKADDMESVVWNEVEKILQNPELIEKAIVGKEKVKKINRHDLDQQIELVARQQDALSKQEERIIDAYRQNIISIEQLKAQVEDIRKSREVLERARQDSTLKLQNTDAREELKNAVDYVAKIRAGIEKFTFETKRKILRLFNTKITVNINGIVDILCTLPKISSPVGFLPENLSHFELARPIYSL